jgi:glutaredoxin 3
MAHVKIYTTHYCPYCTRAKGLLARKGVAFEEVDVTHDPTTRSWLLKATGQRTVPQLFINGVSIGGCDDLYALDRNGKLADLLAQGT